MPEIHDRIREVRELLGVSQQAMAAQCGVTVRSQRNYETGERLPDAQYLAAFAGMGGDVLYVLTGHHASPATAEEQTLLRYFREASSEVRRAALGALLGAAAPVGPKVTQASSGRHAQQFGIVEGDLHIHKREKK